jgi:hypothetical protein
MGMSFAYAVGDQTTARRRTHAHTRFSIELFCCLDEVMREMPKHVQALLWPSEIVTLGILFALKGGGNRAFYHWQVGQQKSAAAVLGRGAAAALGESLQLELQLSKRARAEN